MRHRIFIAINLPENIRKELAVYESMWPELPARWVKPENLHITLVFLGYILDQELLEVLRIVKSVVSRHSSFLLNLNKICYGPPPHQNKFGTGLAQKKPPKMIWAEGEKSKELALLKDDLETSLSNESAPVGFSPENRAFSPHITLSRIRTWQWRQMEPEERPEVNKDISLSFEVNSIEVMESQLKRGGSEYTILESAQLNS